MFAEAGWDLLREPAASVSQIRRLPWSQQIGIAGIIIFTVWEVRTVLYQAAIIKEKRSALALSIPCFSYLFFHNTVAIIYGWYQDLDSLVVNALVLMLPYAILLRNTFQVRALTNLDRRWLIAGFGMMLVMLAGKTYHAVLFFLFSLGSLYALFTQMSELIMRRWSAKQLTGVLKRRVFVCFALQNAAWLMYAWGVNDWPLITLSALGGLISVSIVTLLSSRT